MKKFNVGSQTVHVDAEIRCLLIVVSCCGLVGVIGSDLGGSVE